MFVEVVLGKSADPAKLTAAWGAVLAVLREVGDRWQGATVGADEDGAFVALLGFESEEGARNTLDHLAEGAPWSALKALLANSEFHECPDVRAFVTGDLSEISSVEVLHGHAPNGAGLTASFEAAVRTAQKQSTVVAGLWCWSGDGFGATAVYRRSRAGGEGPDAALAPPFQESRSVSLQRPWSVFSFGTAPLPFAMTTPKR